MKAFWEESLALLRTRLNEHAINTWITPMVCEDLSETTVVFSVPNNFFATWIRDNYLKIISDSINEITGRTLSIDLRLREESPETDGLAVEIPIPHVGCDKETQSITEYARKRNINPRYTFESFVVGSCNQFAHAAARSVSENLGASYNPLFIYGSVGLGKTHLMSAVGYAVACRDRSKNIAFVTSEEFTNEMINAIRFDRMVDFRNKYRSLDLLMIDDIQFIAGKERTQEEFFHTFNSIYEASKQIIITSDCFPNEIPELEHRLRSRFSWGLIADMGSPDLETKVAILKRKAFEDNFDLPDDVTYFLAEQVESNIRELVGYLIRVIAMSTLQGIPISVNLSKMALREILHRNTKTITVDDIIACVSKSFNVKPADVKSRKKHKLYSLPRQVGMFLSRNLTELSYPEIGAAFGGKDHSTVVYAAKKIEKKIDQDHSFKNLIEALKKDIKGI